MILSNWSDKWKFFYLHDNIREASRWLCCHCLFTLVTQCTLKGFLSTTNLQTAATLLWLILYSSGFTVEFTDAVHLVLGHSDKSHCKAQWLEPSWTQETGSGKSYWSPLDLKDAPVYFWPVQPNLRKGIYGRKKRKDNWLRGISTVNKCAGVYWSIKNWSQYTVTLQPPQWFYDYLAFL